MIKKIAALLSAIFLSGCISSGTKVTDDQMMQFRKGMTTESEVIARLGQPNGTSRASDGTITDVYMYVHATPDAVDYIPVVGLLAGGATGKSNTVTFIFTPDRVLKDYTSASATQKVKTGLIQ
jgi:outer membrane protein assembly factor BamE (lipoprotein component of BamABCDE complex)